MICPSCKNEKWDKDVCPQCHLDEKAALLIRAETYGLEGKHDLELEFYNRYLRIEPTSINILIKRANNLHIAAISSSEERLFNQANEALLFIIEKDWSLEKAHYYRVNLFFHFGKLNILKTEYEQMCLGNEIRKKVCDDILKVISLTEKFNQGHLGSSVNAAFDGNVLLKSFLPLLIGLPLLLGAVYRTVLLLSAKEENDTVMAAGIFMLLGASILILILFCMRSYSMAKKKKVS